MRRRRLLLTACALPMAGCAGAPHTIQAPAPGHPPLARMVLLLDTDLIGAAFAAYRGTVPFEHPRVGAQGFIDQLTASLASRAREAGVQASIEVVSLKAGTPPVVRAHAAEPVLAVRMSAYTRRYDMQGGADRGWAGDTNWEFTLTERAANGRHALTWRAVLRSVNLNPVLCGNYAGCSQSLAQQLFGQLRENGLVR